MNGTFQAFQEAHEHDGYNSSGHVVLHCIRVEVRESWGRRRAYPACEASKLFAKIAQTKTLRSMDLQHIHALGFGIWDQSSSSELQIDTVE